MPRHFLSGRELDGAAIAALIDRALELKAAPRSSAALAERFIGLIFEKPSTRTRVSFEVGVVELGGHPLILRGDEMQISRGEALRDTALVSRATSTPSACGPVRTRRLRSSRAQLDPGLQHAHGRAPSLPGARRPADAARGVRLPRGAPGGLRRRRQQRRALACDARRAAGVEVVVASPEGYELEAGIGAQLVRDPAEAVRGAHAVYTDVWVSMGDEEAAAPGGLRSSATVSMMPCSTSLGPT